MTTKYQPGVRVSEYLLEECLGAGTFGEVWQARHHVWESDRVAVKLPTEPEYVRYLQREGVVVHGLKHPNIVRVIGLDPYGDIPYLVMELVKGPSLRQVVADHAHGLPIEQAVIVLRGVLQAMAAAHDANIIHRDVKPGNVLLGLAGRPLTALAVDDVKVGDFGLGFASAETLRSVIEQSGSIARDERSATLTGTLAYMAPELRDGGQLPSPQSDLYSIGVMLFEVLTGERPAGAELPSTIRPDVPAALDEIFRRMYARHDRRYATAHAVLEDLALRWGRDGRLLPPRAATGAPVPPIHRDAASRVIGTCPACHGTIDADDQYCTHCGKQLVHSVRRCPSCGGYPAPHDRFCIFCGTALASSGE